MTVRLEAEDIAALGFVGGADVPEWFFMNAVPGRETVGRGSYAVILDHPEREDLVIRFSAEEDGWVWNAIVGEPDEFRPRILGAAHISPGYWVCVTERLAELDPETFPDVIGDMRLLARLGTERYAEIMTEESEAERLFPGVSAALASVSIPDDLREENLMMRGDHLVINDPQAVMTEVQRQILVDHYHVEMTGLSAEMEP